LYADVPELIPTFGLPKNHRYIGPVLWSPVVDLPEWWDDLPNDRPLVYATLGSSGQSELLPRVLEALAELPVVTLASTAERISLAGLPDNAFVAEYLPGERVAARASLVICNGGSPTAQQALAQGVPVLGIPGNLDQHLNMAYLKRAGVGLVVRSERVSVTRLREAIEELLHDPNYRQRAQQAREHLCAYDAQAQFAALLADLV